MKFMTRSDDGTQLNDDVGLVLDKTHVIPTWHISAMGSAKPRLRLARANTPECSQPQTFGEQWNRY
jgi:hypothetical protein